MSDSKLELPTEFSDRFCLQEAQLEAYLSSVHGGHPVHYSESVAREAGFQGIPLAGVHVTGAALATFTRCFASRPIQLLALQSRFLCPVYPGSTIIVSARLDLASVKWRPHYQAGRYAAHCLLDGGAKAVELDIELRLMLVNA